MKPINVFYLTNIIIIIWTSLLNNPSHRRQLYFGQLEKVVNQNSTSYTLFMNSYTFS